MKGNTEDSSFILFSLKNGGLRHTRQRSEVLNAIFEMEGHFRVRDVVRRLEERGNTVSRPTVYRCVKLLVRCGILTPAGSQGGTQEFELSRSGERHVHLKCLSCGKDEEIPARNLESAVFAETCRIGFTPFDFTLGVRGICAGCRAEREKG